MKIYIASSWKNQHAVEMLTALIRGCGHEIYSFIENNHGEGYNPNESISFEEWVETDQAQRCFEYDIRWASKADLVIYISPSGTDAWAEVGIAVASGKPVIGLYAKGEQSGLMRKLVVWLKDYHEIIEYLQRANRVENG